MSDEVIVFGGDTDTPLRLEAEGNSELRFSSYLDIRTSEYPEYDGPYIFIPSMVEQIAHTEDTVLRDNVTVQAVPYYETPNDAGGVTISMLS